MSDTLIPTRPPNKGEELLREKFAESIAGQSELMNKLARQLITVELAIPGLYATVLKLAQGEDATLPQNNWLYVTAVLWFAALLLTLISLIPRSWQVDPSILKEDPAGDGQALGLEEFFGRSARYKRRLLIPACLLFWLGILTAVLTVF